MEQEFGAGRSGIGRVQELHPHRDGGDPRIQVMIRVSCRGRWDAIDLCLGKEGAAEGRTVRQGKGVIDVGFQLPR